MYVLGGVLILGEVLGDLNDAISLVTPVVAGTGTACIVLLWLLARFLLPLYPLPWVVGEQRILVRKLGILPTSFAAGMVLLLWTPWVITRWQPLPPQTKGFLQFDRIDIVSQASAIAPGRQFAVNVYSLNPGPQRVLNAYGHSWAIVENVDEQTNRRIRMLVDKELIPIREQYLAGKKKGKAEVGVGKSIWMKEEAMPFIFSDVVRLQYSLHHRILTLPHG